MLKIKIHVALAEIDQAVHNDRPHVFSIQYVKKDGTVGKKNRVRKSGTNPALGKTTGSTGFRYNVKRRGILLLHDVETDQPFALKIALITHYNGVQIQH